ncbi:MAG: cutinase family protein [Leucobacter sp.]
MRDVSAWSASRVRRFFGSALIVLFGGLGLVGCAPEVDAEATRESLSQATEDPSPPDAAETYDAELHPEPIVDPVDCSPYLVVTARGMGEPTKGQLLSPVAREISESRPDDVQILDLPYPADTDVREGGTFGVRLLIDTLNVQTDACPGQRFVLLGYSQGALVLGDALSDPDARLVGGTAGRLESETADRIIAVVFYGNPRFNGSEEYAVGSYLPSLDGFLPRPEGSLGAYADRARDYCVRDDFMCQSRLDLDESGHVAYYSNGMQQDGAAFVITRLDPARGEAETGDRGPRGE